MYEVLVHYNCSSNIGVCVLFMGHMLKLREVISSLSLLPLHFLSVHLFFLFLLLFLYFKQILILFLSHKYSSISFSLFTQIFSLLSVCHPYTHSFSLYTLLCSSSLHLCCLFVYHSYTLSFLSVHASTVCMFERERECLFHQI